jgi:hypothetical protein
MRFAQNILHVIYINKTHKHWHLNKWLWLGFPIMVGHNGGFVSPATSEVVDANLSTVPLWQPGYEMVLD